MALQLDIPIIPVLVERGQMPPSQNMPEGVRDLTRLNALIVEVGPDFDNQIARLITAIDKVKVAPANTEARSPELTPQFAAIPDKVEVASAKTELRPPELAPQFTAIPVSPPTPSRTLFRKLLFPLTFKPADNVWARIAKGYFNLLAWSLYVVVALFILGLLTTGKIPS
jgi:hypothetical protein